MQPRLPYDDVAWEKSEAVADSWIRQFLDPEVLQPVGEFLVRHHSPGDPVEFSFLGKGAYNVAFQMKYENANTAVIRFSQPGATMFPEEKTRNEVAAMRYISHHTSIPVPLVHRSGSKKESPLGLSPFIIMDYIEHDTCMYDALNTPGCPKGDRGTLDSDISEEKLEALYREVADVLLQLSRPSLPRIGSLDQVDDFTWNVTARPLSMPMNTLIQLGSLPQTQFPTTALATASSYFKTLADLHLAHLTNQRNDSISSSSDCHRKLVARYLFRKLAREHRLTKQQRASALDKGPFKLWCDDFRPANILLDKALKIVGVVDWEFTYAAPVEFSFAPPWWLLIEKPEYWPKGLNDWCSVYEQRLQTFLGAMRYQEDKAVEQGWLESAQRAVLSGGMQDSWESGDFWIAYAARNSFAFDLVYWNKIDQRFFGETSSAVEDVWKERIRLLESGERDEIEELVAVKVEEMETRVLAWDPDGYTKELAEKGAEDSPAVVQRGK
ncbi:kinase-like domain-containing protein [Aspergillus varians]